MSLWWSKIFADLTHSDGINIPTGEEYKINNVSVLNATTLGGDVLASSLTSVGTLLDLTVTNTITGAISGNAGTVTDGVYTTDKLSALAATTSAELAGVISDETGTGKLVFATAPTFTGVISITGDTIVRGSTSVTSIGLNSGVSNSGNNTVSVGSASLYYNTGNYAIGIGTGALGTNVGSNAVGLGDSSLSYNTGSYAIGIGGSSLYNNIGGTATGVGRESLVYNEGDGNTAVGQLSFSTFSPDSGNAENFTTALADNKITITGHSFGANGTYRNLSVSTGGTLPTGLGAGVQQWLIVDANTLQCRTSAFTAASGSGTHTLTPQYIYTNTTALGYNAEPTASNQVMLGDANVTSVVTAGALSSGTTTITATADDTDVSGVNTVFINPGGATVIGAFVGGVVGQKLNVVIVDADQNVTLEHNEGTGNQNIFLHTGGDELLASVYGGWNLVCDGTSWYDISSA